MTKTQSSVHLFLKCSSFHFIDKICTYLPQFILVYFISFMLFYLFSLNSCLIYFPGNVSCSAYEQQGWASSHKNGQTKETEYQQFKYV